MDITDRRYESATLNIVISSYKELECITFFILSKKRSITAPGGYLSVQGAQKLLYSMM